MKSKRQYSNGIQVEYFQKLAGGPETVTLNFHEGQSVELNLKKCEVAKNISRTVCRFPRTINEGKFEFQTKDGQSKTIVQLISGYINIIKESQKTGYKFNQPDVTERRIMIYRNEPNRANIIKNNHVADDAFDDGVDDDDKDYVDDEDDDDKDDYEEDDEDHDDEDDDDEDEDDEDDEEHDEYNDEDGYYNDEDNQYYDDIKNDRTLLLP